MKTDALRVFISYSHADEWLKNELIKHFSALKRGGFIDVWHDRMIPPGGLLENEIDSRLHESQIFLFLISNDFITSDYCFEKEYLEAVKIRDAGEAEIIPIIVRDCDWDVGNLRKYNALPPDGTPVTRGASSRTDAQQRDAAWLEVIKGIKVVVSALKKKLQPPELSVEYLSRLYHIDFIRHVNLQVFDEKLVAIGPNVYAESNKEQITTFERLVEVCEAEQAVLVTGTDRSGKTLAAKVMQEKLTETGSPCILISGKQIKNRSIEKIIDTAKVKQYGLTDFPNGKFKIIIDDFDECTLSDRIKEIIVKTIHEVYAGSIITSYSSAPSVLFASNDLPTPFTAQITPLNDAKLFELVRKWLNVGYSEEESASDLAVLTTYEKLQLVFGQTELEKFAYTAITFLELIDTATGSDIAFSSFAACYDTLITSRLQKASINWRSFDEAKNFLALVAYRAYNENAAGCISRDSFDECLDIFEDQYLSSKQSLKAMAIGLFIREDEDGYSFYEEYLWYFLCARFVVKTLQVNDHAKYVEFVSSCAENIFQKKFANIVIYIAYFSNDNFVLTSLLTTLDQLFSKADDWVLSDDTREITLGLATKENLLIDAKSDVNENRVALLQEKVADIIEDAERVVARYTLPFLNSSIGDGKFNTNIEDGATDADSYMKSVNALLRIHSIIGQILNSRTGTYDARLILDCITRMVQASGRYASLNHAIATVLLHDKENQKDVISKIYHKSKLTDEEKYEKVTRIFAFWSIYLSHAGLARYLGQEHSIRALAKLSSKYENGDALTLKGNIPYNFSFVLLVARLYHTGKIDKDYVEDCLRRYGDESSIMALLRVVMHIYAYYFPLEIEDKQWIAGKLKMSLKKIEVQKMKSSGLARVRHVVR
ncbi:toll/interleukin-1 receptor domain-containing protein [Methylobacterium sp. J-030]|uniref:TIR domain-containing protein n=1 Tax=Methylobacterium sp. J-030 TaxID=2836627 RepID=UPI001FBAE229|nr:toll/interleukin-1 receptor domain-containing protein [Methylobacterium sp. J-030]MCJ2069241.1 toll/interleukin-1 receptor domain-containing protein [Methylobacterium sp. J-030]